MIYIHGSGLEGVIINVGGSYSMGEYKFDIEGDDQKISGSVNQFPRLRLGSYDLLYRCLRSQTLGAGVFVQSALVKLDLWPRGNRRASRPLGKISLRALENKHLEYIFYQSDGINVWKKGTIPRNDGVLISLWYSMDRRLKDRNG